MDSEYSISYWKIRNRSRGSSLFALYVLVLSALILMFSFLDLANFVQTFNQDLLPKYFYALLVMLTIPVYVMRPLGFFKYLRSHIIVLLIAFIFLNSIHWLMHVSFGNTAAAEIVTTRMQNFVLAILIGGVICRCDAKNVGRICLVLVCLLVGLQILDFVDPSLMAGPGRVEVIKGRAASTLLNPNKAGEALVLLCLLSFLSVENRNSRLWIYMLVWLGVVVTFSRAAMAAMVFILIYGYVFHLVPRAKVILVGVLGIIGATLIAAVFSSILIQFVDISGLENIYNRLQFFSRFNIGDDSAQSRLNIANEALLLFSDNPLAGVGGGYTSLWGVAEIQPHNFQLLLLAEYGLIGYGLFLVMIFLIARGGSYFWSLGENRVSYLAVFVLIWFSFFTHNIFDYMYWFMFIILTSKVSFMNRRYSISNDHEG